MQYREYGKTGMRLSTLGYGCMRLPSVDGEVDEDEAIRCLREAVERGVNYFDTAWFYHGGNSEIVLGRALKDGYRERIFLSTKNKEKTTDGKKWRSLLDEQLVKLDVDYLDVYHFHGINWEQWTEKLSVPGGPLDEMRNAQKEGIVKHCAFSFHGDAGDVMKLVDTGEFDGMLVQYNLLDRSNEEGIAYANSKGMGVIVMGPVGGGRLGGASKALQEMIPGDVKSTPEAALRFVMSNPNVTVALSGMSAMDHVLQNTETASKEEALSPEEREQIEAMLEENKRLSDLYCTGCNYCMPCPNDVDIPGNFRLMNFLKVYDLDAHARDGYSGMAKKKVDGVETDVSASACHQCGECEPKCPQDIPIIDQLEEVAEALA